MITSRCAATVAPVCTLALWMAAAGADVTSSKFDSVYYKDFPLFSTHASEKAATQVINRFGPVGIGIELRLPPFQMYVQSIEKGSPAEATGKLKPGQMIESINGEVLKDIDPRIILGGIIAKAEATDGRVVLRVKAKPEDQAEDVIVQIPVLGAYAKTWPLDCPKSAKIVRGQADYLAKLPKGTGPGLGLLFLLSTGEPQDLAVAREWVREYAATTKDSPTIDIYPWYLGYSFGLCEYYLRTGDETVLPVIEKIADGIKRKMYNGGWNCRGEVNITYGHLNAAGVHCVTFLLLARECGAKVDEYTLQESLKHFFRYAGKGNVPYGDGTPESGFVDNGKTGKLAFAMAAAASLTPAGEKSVYAKARDISAIKGFYSTSWMLHGHTGGGIGEIWRSASMGLMHDTKPTKYREFMDHRTWHYDLSRRFDGSFTCLGGGQYDDPSWGVGYALTYTVPRKTLRVTGAPPTKYSKTYTLPERPWGTPADDAFYSLVPAADKNGKRQDVDAEKLPTDASWPLLRRVNDPSVSDDVLLMYARHPDQGVREMSAGAIAAQSRDHLIVELLRDKDPRPRQAATIAINGFRKKGEVGPVERLTDEMTGLLVGMINDPDESWWVVTNALPCLGMAKPELLAPHVDRLCHWLEHDDWWLRRGAILALDGLATDERFAPKILPIVGRLLATNRTMTMAYTLSGLVGQLENAKPEVRALAVKTLGQAYADFPKTMAAPGGADMNSAAEAIVAEHARGLSKAPGGMDELFTRGRLRYPDTSLPHQKLFLEADPAKFGPELQGAMKQIIRDRVIPEFLGKATHLASNRKLLLEEAASGKPLVDGMYYPEPRSDALVRLYNRMGVHDYDWHDFGPALNTMRWDYYSFDPQDGRLPGTGTRYRAVAYPPGMENWFAPEFDAQKAGWKSGLQPFGQAQGQLVSVPGKCPGALDFCRCGEPMQTLWEKEVLLMRGTFNYPKLREGHRYQLLVGGMSHVGGGEGFRIYVNGKPMFERERGVGKREGGKPIAYAIEKKWWPEFDAPVTIAATSFLQVEQGDVRKNKFFVWIQEMKMPPVEELVRESITAVPMRSSAWQALQNDPEAPDRQPDEGLFRYDGSFSDNPTVHGRWQVVAQVAKPEDFTGDPAKAPFNPKAVPFTEITFQGKGATDNLLFVWSGDTLMNLDRNEALKMTVKSVGGTDYLFVEAGGFAPNHPRGWTPPLVVLKRAGG